MTTFDLEADVVVVGGGAAAHAAAVAASAAGASVVIVEKAAETGGTTAKSSGAYWIPNNSFLRSRGVDDPRDDALRLMARLSYPSVYDPDDDHLGLDERHHRLLAAFYDNASPVIDELARLGALRSMPQPLFGEQVGDVDWAIPEYHAELPENKAPYGADPAARLRPVQRRARWGRDRQPVPGLPRRPVGDDADRSSGEPARDRRVGTGDRRRRRARRPDRRHRRPAGRRVRHRRVHPRPDQGARLPPADRSSGAAPCPRTPGTSSAWRRVSAPSSGTWRTRSGPRAPSNRPWPTRRSARSRTSSSRSATRW